MVGLILLAGLIGGAVGTVLTPLLAVPLLGLVGFSVAGPVAGSLAAGIQSSIGIVSAGSLFACAQSVAMGASIPGLVQVVGGIFGAILSTAAAFAV